AQVCRRLDGIPLAIELAAARVRVLSVEQIAARLDDRFRLLGAPHRGALPHQQTLRAAMDWSYDLLSEAERLLLQRLSVFAGGFTLEAAEYVCSDSEAAIGEGADPSAVGRLRARQGGHPHCAVEQKEVLDLLTQLVNKSLVLVDESETGGETRYRLLETIRQYGAEKMAGSGEGARLQARHADWFCRLAERAERELRGSVQGEWLRRLEIDHDNLRAALRWAVETEEEAVPEKRQTALRLGAALARFWETRGYWSEGREQLRRLLALPWDPQTASRELGLVRARVLHGAGILAFYQGDYTDARALLEECLSSSAAAGERRARAAALNSLGIVALSQGDFATARAKYEESLAIRRDLNDREGIASTLNNLGMVAQYQSDFATARAKYEESLAIRRTLGDLTDIAASLNNLGNVAFLEGDFEAAAALYEESLALKRKLGDRPGIAGTLDNLGLVAQCRGDAATARRLHEESLTLRRELGDRPGIAQSLHGLGGVARFLGETSEARRCYEESLALARALGDRQILAAVLCSLARVSADAGLPDGLDPRALYEESLAIRRALGDRPGMVECLEGLAAFFGDRNDPERAARLLAAAAAARGALGALRLPMEQAEHERDVARTRAALGEAAFAEAWARGEALTLEEAIAETIGKPAAA
ncbi:MAG: tetratricopeptide repeat protein, partial [Chloroflexi bacterium]|nr:tetratricopeptide repeat protein [Chloroflexota bacterium]